MKDLNDMQEVAITAISKTYKLGNLLEVNIAQDYGYTFKFGAYKKALGKCNLSEKIISLSKPWCINNLQEENVLIDTLIHEIAHAIAYELYNDTAHGKAWKMVCKHIGCTGNRTFNLLTHPTVTPPPGKHKYSCPNCDKKHQFHRILKRQTSCGYCAKSFDPRYILTLIPS
jgi:predicted SprT family Zn-dependent metalloprotease